MKTKVLTGKVRFSFVKVFTPEAMNEGEQPKYSLCILIDKNDKTTLKNINQAIDNAIELGKNKLQDKTGNVNKAAIKLPLRDGDIQKPGEAGFEGCMFLNASSVRQPGIVDANREAIISPNELYSGCYGRATLNFYAFNVSGNKGVAVGLNNIQKLAEGERLDGSVSAEEDFADDFEDDELF